MIPYEVVIIAETIALEYKGSAGDYEGYIELAYKIYRRLKLEAEAAEKADRALDD